MNPAAIRSIPAAPGEAFFDRLTNAMRYAPEGPIEVTLTWDDERTAGNIRHSTPFIGGASRRAVNEGWADFVPAHFSDLPGLIRSGQLSSEVVFAQCSPMDEHGFFALGVSTDYTLAAVSRARSRSRRLRTLAS